MLLILIFSLHDSFLEPPVFSFHEIRSLTAKMHQQISSGTLDAPSWRPIRVAKLAARMYAPLGTEMSLGDYVRVVRTFLEALKLAEASRTDAGNSSGSDHITSPLDDESAINSRIVELGQDLKVKLQFYASPASC